MDAGHFPVKRTVGDRVRVEADVFGDGHDHVMAWLLYRYVPHGPQNGQAPGPWQQVKMTALGNDRWAGEFAVTELGAYQYTVAGAVIWRSALPLGRRLMLICSMARSWSKRPRRARARLTQKSCGAGRRG